MGACCSAHGQVNDVEVTVNGVEPRKKSFLQVLSPFANAESTKEPKTVAVKSDSAVKVAVIVRPLLDFESQRGCNAIVEVAQPNRVSLPGRGVAGPAHFTFDRVYSQAENLFPEMVVNVLDRYFQGFNGTILAYGQTGAGKTHAMGTSASAKDLTGKGIKHNGAAVIPRSLERLFKYVSSASKIYDIKLTLQFVELYEERLQDLLLPSSSGQAANGGDTTPRQVNAAGSTSGNFAVSHSPQPGRKGSGPAGATAAGQQHSGGQGVSIRELPNGEIELLGCTEVEIDSREQVAELLQAGNATRATAAHRLNQESSRSHAILIVALEQHAKPSARIQDELRYLRSKLHLVDLAGSERAKETGATGQRFAEGVSINRGLLELGNVINALTEGQNRRHIPYRNSKLTRLLQDSLGGNSETLFIACVSPADANADHTISTLRYATRAMKIKNQLHLNNFMSPAEEISFLKAQVAQLQKESGVLRAKLAEMGVAA